MNTFRAVVRALRFEEERQREVLAPAEVWSGNARLVRGDGRHGFAADEGTGARLPLFPGTGPAAADDDAADRLDLIRDTVGELPAARRDRYVAVYDIARADAGLIAYDEALAAISKAWSASDADTEARTLVGELDAERRHRTATRAVAARRGIPGLGRSGAGIDRSGRVGRDDGSRGEGIASADCTSANRCGTPRTD